jgi:RsiW-degrading membrane proteinase PrsW (M82 family)
MGTLLFPKTEGRPFEEIVADVMINPLTMLVEAICIALLVFVLFDSLSGPFGEDEAAKIMLLSGLGAFSIPFIYFAAAWLFERHEEGKPLRFFAGMFFWGMLAAFLSLLISSTLVAGLQLGDLEAYTLVATMAVAPLVEEVLKGLGVLFMSGHHEYSDTLTGLLLGFSCGAGFAFVENWFYFSSKVNPFDVGLASWVALIIYRSLFNTLAHGCFTASVSTAIGYLKGVDRMKRFARLAFVPGLFLAVAIHTIFNLSALADGFVIASQQVTFFIFNPMLIILLAAMFFLVLVVAVVDEKRRAVQRKAGTEVAAQGLGRNYY